MEIENRGIGHGESGRVPPPPSQWKRKWGKKPLRQKTDHYTIWRNTYNKYLFQLYKEMIRSLNSPKAVGLRDVDFEEFASFAYRTSSGYISQYA